VDNPRGLIRPGHTADVHFTGFQRQGEVIEPPTNKIYSDISGTVENVLVREGGRVKEDTTILTLSAPSHSVSISQQMNRIRSAEISTARQQKSLEDLTVDSPIDGEVTELEIEEGDEVSPGTTLAKVSDYDSFQLTIEVDELEIGSVKIGQSAEIDVDAVPDKDISGEVASISSTPSVTDGAAAYPVKIVVLAHEGLMEGMSASAEVEVDRRTDVIVVPSEAVVTADGQSTVQVVTEEGLEVREVKTGLSDGTHTEIISGIKEGEEVILAHIGDEPQMHFGPPGGR